MDIINRLRHGYHAFKEIPEQSVQAAGPYRDTEFGITQDSVFKRYPLSTWSSDTLLAKHRFKAYERMFSTDDTIEMCITAMKIMRLGSGYEIEAASEDSADVRVADFVGYVLEHLQGQHHSEVLFNIMGALEMGWSMQEILYTVIKGGEWDGMIGVTKLRSKDPKYYNLKTDEYGDPASVVSLVLPLFGREFPVDKFLIYSFQKRYEDLYGRARLRTLYFWWQQKQTAMLAAGVYGEKFGIPLPIGYYPKHFTKQQQTDLLTSLKQLRYEQAMIAPEGANVDFKEASSKAEFFLNIIEKADHQMRMCILGQTLTSATGGSGTKGGGESKGGGLGTLGNVQYDVLLQYLDYVGNDLATGPMACFIKKLVDYNFSGVTSYPRLRFRQIDDAAAIGRVTTFLTAVEKGAIKPKSTDEDIIRKLIGFTGTVIDKMALRPARISQKPVIQVAVPKEPISANDAPVATTEPMTMVAPGLAGMVASSSSYRTMSRLAGAYGYSEDTDLVAKSKTELEAARANLKAQLKAGSMSLEAVNKEWAHHVKDHNETRSKAGLKPDSDTDKFAEPKFPGVARRSYTKFEEKADFDELRKAMVDNLDDMLPDIKDELRSMVDGVLRQVQRERIIEDSATSKIKDLQMRGKAGLTELFRSQLEKVVKSAAKTARAEVKSVAKNAELGDLEPEDVLDYVKNKAFWMTDVTSTKLLDIIKGQLYQGIKTGKSYGDTAFLIEGALESYFGTPGLPDELAGNRLETMVRTTMNDAYNQSRDAVFRSEDMAGLIVAYQYSAVLDDRVRPSHEAMDGRIFLINDPIWKTWTPLNGFNCRCVLIPITKYEEFEVSDYPPADVKPDEGFK